MADENKYSPEFSKQTDYYIKFLIYHLAIIITIVFSLYGAVKKVEDEDVEKKVEEINSLRAISNTLPLYAINDNIIKGMYFEKESCTDNDTVLNNLYSIRLTLSAPVFPGLAKDSVQKKYLSDSVNKAIDDIKTAKDRQIKLLKEIDSLSANAFQLKLTFLGDAQVDLRIWVFFLPFIFLLSCIYIFILDYKILLLKKQALVSGNPLAIEMHYPFFFLRSLLLFVEIFLVTFYIYIILLFFNIQASSLKNYVLYAVLFFGYYGFVYCLYYAERIRMGTINAVDQIFLYRKLAVIWKRITVSLSKINPFTYLGTGQLLMIATLFLVMTYNGCDEKKKFSKDEQSKGYELITRSKVLWEVYTKNYVDQDKDCEKTRDLYKNNNDLITLIQVSGALAYKYLYLFLFLALLVSFSWYWQKKRKVLFKISSFIIIFSVFTFTVYFGLYRLFEFPSYSFPLSLVCMLYWYFSFYKRTEDPAFFGLKHLKGLIIFLFPLFILSVINIIKMNPHRNGWIYFYVSLWLLLIAVVYLPLNNKTVSTTGT